MYTHDCTMVSCFEVEIRSTGCGGASPPSPDQIGVSNPRFAKKTQTCQPIYNVLPPSLSLLSLPINRYVYMYHNMHLCVIYLHVYTLYICTYMILHAFACMHTLDHDHSFIFSCIHLDVNKLTCL